MKCYVKAWLLTLNVLVGIFAFMKITNCVFFAIYFYSIRYLLYPNNNTLFLGEVKKLIK